MIRLRFLVPFLFICVSTHYVSAQSQLKNELDSLDRLIKKSTTDTARVKLLHQSAYACMRHSEFKDAKPYVKRAKEVIDRLKWDEGLADHYHLEGIFRFYQGKYDESLLYNNKALAIRKKQKDWRGMAASYGNIGLIYQVQGDLSKALESQINGLRMEEKMNHKDGMAASYSNIGLIFERLGDNKKAISYYRKALKIRLKLNDTRQLVTVYSNLGNVHLGFKNYDSSIYYHTRSMQLAEKHQNENAVGMALANIGDVYFEQKLYHKSLECQLRCMEISERVGDDRVWISATGNVGACYERLGDLDKALDYTLRAIKRANEVESPPLAVASMGVLETIYERMGKHKEALQAFKDYIALRDTLVNEEKNNEIARKEIEYEFQKKEEISKQAERENARRQRIIIYSVSIGFIVVLLVALFIFRNLRINKKKNKIIQEQKHLVEEKQKEIVDSINYAKRIQYALLAHDDLLKKNLPEHFVLFKPKDIVSGDFYWATRAVQRSVFGVQNNNEQRKENTEHFYLAVCDSTGHGVPGAFMSLLNISFLNEAITEKGIEKPNEVFNHVRQRLIENISHDGAQDGMDATLVKFKIQDSTFEIEYAAAYNAPLVIRNGELLSFPCDKMPIGKSESLTPFKLYTMQLQKGDLLYLFTDGYADQFGGPQGKKFKEANLRKLLVQVHTQPLEQQKTLLLQHMDTWAADHEQIDDICIVGIKL